MSDEELAREQQRTDIWDRIYAKGPLSLEQLADEMQMTIPTVVGLVDHSWFSLQDELVSIATDGES